MWFLAFVFLVQYLTVSFWLKTDVTDVIITQWLNLDDSLIIFIQLWGKKYLVWVQKFGK